MSIEGIGTDIVQLDRIEDLIEKFGYKFSERILSKNELAEYKIAIDKTAFMAKKFAAKEAIAKALGTGFRNGLQFKDIEITHDELGKPEVNISGKAIPKMHLSITDEKSYALAFAVLSI